MEKIQNIPSLSKCANCKRAFNQFSSSAVTGPGDKSWCVLRLSSVAIGNQGMDKVPGGVSKQIAFYKVSHKLHFSQVFFMHKFFLAFNSYRVPVRFAGSRRRRGLNLRGRGGRGNILRISADWIHMLQQRSRGEICPCRHCRWQCKIFASDVNISIFTHFIVFLSLKLLKLGEIASLKFVAWKSV